MVKRRGYESMWQSNNSVERKSFFAYSFQCQIVFIWPINMTMSAATTPGPEWILGAMAIKGIFHIPQSSSVTGTSPSDCLVSYQGHTFGGGRVLTFLQRCSRSILQPQPPVDKALVYVLNKWNYLSHGKASGTYRPVHNTSVAVSHLLNMTSNIHIRKT